jgi:serine/threonine protein kinase
VEYAVRILSVPNETFLEKIKEEIVVMNMCQSENSIRHYFTYFYENTLFMFIEYMHHGSLNNFIRHYRRKIDEGVISYIVRETLKGLVSIHRRRQVHRDLKSDNILVSRHGEVKIGDFGFALQLTKEKITSKELAGTPAWMAPELIKKE